MSEAQSVLSRVVDLSLKFPERTAVESSKGDLTYAALVGLASTLSASIHSCSHTPFVGIFGHRSAEVYAAILGTLGAGFAYVPLNPKFPAERTAAMVTDSGCDTVLVTPESGEAFSKVVGRLQNVTALLLRPNYHLPYVPETVQVAEVDLQGHSDMQAAVRDNAPAYLLFTSGSTGRPKGVPVSWGNLSSYLSYTIQRYEFTPDDRFSQTFDLTFDLSVHDIFTALTSGGTLCCPDERDLYVPTRFIRTKKLTVWFSVPSVAMIAAQLNLLTPGSLSSLRLSLFCGEPLPARLAALWQAAAPSSIVENLYGPTETTIAISSFRWNAQMSPAQCRAGIVPIGRIFPGHESRLTDQKMKRTGWGEAGELCVSGPQVTAGYLNDPAKTAEKYVKFDDAPGRLYYRTGDLVREEPNGVFHYVSRVDHQVKIGGFRVELQEIEGVLREAVSSDTVVAVPWPIREGIISGVVAVMVYIGHLTDEEIVGMCRSRLPSYMVPSRIFRVDELPLNVNGKIDRGRIATMLDEAYGDQTGA